MPLKTETKKRYITRTKEVDRFNKVRTRVELTPAVCDECGFDLIAVNNLKAYHTLTPEQQDDVAEAVKVHKETAHRPESALIIEEDAMPKHWLGEKR